MGFPGGTGGGGDNNIYGSTDVALSSPQDNESLTYDASTDKWTNEMVSGGSGSIPANATLSVFYTGSSWPARPTSRTDVTVQWITYDENAPIPPGGTASDIVIRADPVAGPGNVIAQLDFESQTNGQAVTVSSPWSSVGGSTDFVASNAADTHGTLGARLASIDSFRHITYSHSASTPLLLDLYFIPRTIASMLYVMSLPDAATTRCDWRINTDRTVSIRDAFNAVDTSTATLTLGTTYRAAWRLSSGGQELRIYEGEATSPIITLTGAINNYAHTAIRFGTITNSTGSALDIDTARISDDWLNPFGA